MTNILPSINFDATPGFNEFKFLHQTYSDEFTWRQAINSSYGVVDFTGDPAISPFSTDRPLNVSVSVINPLTIDIAQGYAITPSHQLIVIDSSIPTIPLPDLTTDKTYVIAVEYKLLPSDQTTLNRMKDPVEVRLERPSNTPYGDEPSTLSQAVTITTLTDYYNPALFSDERKQNIIIIAIVTSTTDPITGQLSITVDMTRNSYGLNRPWFSTIDVEHRSKKGSGVVTDNNPHAMEIQDLSSGGFTLYEQYNSRGGVEAKDLIYYGYPGSICYELLTVNRFEIDYTGTITTPEGEVPLAGKYFARLSKQPVRVGSLYQQEQVWNSIPYYWIPGTRIIILGSLEDPLSYAKSLVLEYFSVEALSPPAETTQGLTSFTVQQPVQNQEFIVSNGRALTVLAQTSLSLSTMLGPLKKSYQIMCDGAGSLLISPQPLMSSIKVADITGVAQYTINQSPVGGYGVPITIGLTGVDEGTAPVGYSLNLKLKINGLSETNATIEEDVIFKASQWKENEFTDREEPLQFITTKQKFAFVNYVKSMNSSSDPDNSGTNSAISLWANILDSKYNQAYANVASFFWNGSTATKIKDERLVSTSLQRIDQKQYRFPTILPESDASFTQELFSVLLDPPLTDPNKITSRLALELDDDRWYGETWKEFSTSDSAGQITLFGNIVRLTNKETIRLTNDKYLTCVSSLSINGVQRGEVLIDSDPVVMRNNIIATINDSIFDSSWYASIGTSSNPPINLTRRAAYPDGFIENIRKELKFTYLFSVGDLISININNIDVDTFNLSENPVLTTNGSNGVIISTPVPHNYIVGDIVNVSGLTGFNGILTGDLNGAKTILTIEDPTHFSYLATTASATGLGGGLNGVVQKDIECTGTMTHLDMLNLIVSKVNAMSSFTGVTSVSIPKNTDDIYPCTPNSVTDVWTSSSHGLSAGTIIRFLGTGGGVNTTQPYFIINPTTDTFQVSLTESGSAVDLTDDSINNASTILDYLIFNGNVNGDDFNILVPTSPPKHSNPATIAASFSFTQPSGGVLSTDHLPPKYLSKQKPWQYLTRGILWPGVSIRGKIALFNNTPATITNYDQIELIPGKLITARRGNSVNADPSIGEFLVDPYSLINTLTNIKETINNPRFSSGAIAELNNTGTEVDVFISGLASASMRLLIEGTASTWDLTNYEIIGGGNDNSHGFVKSINPLTNAEFRYQIVDLEDFTPTPNPLIPKWFYSRIWSPWTPMHSISPTSFDFAAPPPKSFYCIQLRLTGEPGKSNGFSLYQFSPQTSGASLVQLQQEILDLQTELYAARGNLADLSSRLIDTIDVDGNPIKDSELARASTSTIFPTTSSLKDRLDQVDALTYWWTGQTTNQLLPTSMAKVTSPNMMLSGTNDLVTLFASKKLQVNADISEPLILSVQGNSYRYARPYIIDFTGKSTLATPYYISVETSSTNALGLTVLSSTLNSSITIDTDILTDISVNFGNVSTILNLGTPLVLTMTLATKDYYFPIKQAPSSNTLQIYGKFPASVPSGTTYEIKSPQELDFNIESSRVDAPNKLYIAQAMYNGTTLSSIIPYRYLNSYVSDLESVDASSTGYYNQVVFEHNLGFLPKNFIIYFYQNTSEAEPKVLHIGEEAIVKVTTTTITVRNRYEYLAARNYNGDALESGYIQVIV